MLIGILGGTGKEGAGLALRWAEAGHEIIIGSRDADRARAKAEELGAQAKIRLSGASNRDAATRAEIVVLTLPASGLAATLGDLKDACRGKVVISTVVPLTFGGGRLFTPPSQGSSAEEVQELLGAEARVVAAFHHIAAHELASTDHAIDCDLLHCGGASQATEKGPAASLAPSAAGSTYVAVRAEGGATRRGLSENYASPAAFGRRL